ncbi:MAG: hypothetical protein HQK98_02165 [Nitrospirae bacterium]|nr:hypothetical protein [Nitrospirota bacterium]
MRIRLILPVLLIVLSVFVAQNMAEAGLFRWIDKNGQSHVTDYPPPNEEDTEAVPPETKASPKPRNAEATPKTPPPPSASAAPQLPKKTPPPPAATVTPHPQKTAQPPVTAPAPSPVVKATPAPAQPSATAAPMPPARPVAKRNVPMPQKSSPASFPIEPKTFLRILIGAFVLILLGALLYGYFLYKIAVRLGVSSPWMAWITGLQLYTMAQTAGKPWWWIFLMLIPIVNIAVMVLIWMAICERLQVNKKFGFLCLGSPLIGLIISRVVPLFVVFSKENLSTLLGIYGGLFVILLLTTAAQPVICYWLATRTRRSDSSSYVPLGSSSAPDYEHDTVPLNQPDYIADAGFGAAVGLAAGEFPAVSPEAEYEHKRTEDDETIGIQMSNEHDEFTVEQSVDEDSGVTFAVEQGAVDSEALTLDPGAADSEAFTLDPDAITLDPGAVDSEAFTLDAATPADAPTPEPPDEVPDETTADHGKGEEIEFSLDEFTLEGEPQTNPSSQREGQIDQDEGYKDDLTEIALDEGLDVKIQDGIELEPEPEITSEFNFQLESDELPGTGEDTYEREGLELPQAGDIQLETEEFSTDLDVNPALEDSGSAVSLELDNYERVEQPMAETDEGQMQIELPPGFSLDIAGAPDELEIVRETGDTKEQEFDISPEYSLDIDRPIEDEAGNLKIDTSDFKSLAELVELEMGQDTPDTAAEADKGIQPQAPEMPETLEMGEAPEIESKPKKAAKSKKGAKSKKDAAPEVPEPIIEPVVPTKPKVSAKPDNEWTLEDILVAGLKLEMDEQDGHDSKDGHKEEKP